MRLFQCFRLGISRDLERDVNRHLPLNITFSMKVHQSTYNVKFTLCLAVQFNVIPSYLLSHFVSAGPITVILRAARHERRDVVAFQFVGQFTEIIARGGSGSSGC